MSDLLSGSTVTSFIALGSNLDSPLTQVETAIGEIGELPGCQLLASSSRYRSRAIGPGRQADYINAVVCIETGLSATSLLQALQNLERQHGRVRRERWGPRTLDLDILLYGHCRIEQPGLQIPHPRLYERNFVIYPLSEIAPMLTLPDGRAIQSVRAALPGQGLTKLVPA